MLEFREPRSELEEVLTELGNAFFALLGLVRDELVVDVALIVVEGAGEGGDGGGELALERGIGGRGGCGGEGVKVGADGFALPEGGVVYGALDGGFC